MRAKRSIGVPMYSVWCWLIFPFLNARSIHKQMTVVYFPSIISSPMHPPTPPPPPCLQRYWRYYWFYLKSRFCCIKNVIYQYQVDTCFSLGGGGAAMGGGVMLQNGFNQWGGGVIKHTRNSHCLSSYIQHTVIRLNTRHIFNCNGGLLLNWLHCI